MVCEGRELSLHSPKRVYRRPGSHCVKTTEKEQKKQLGGYNAMPVWEEDLEAGQSGGLLLSIVSAADECLNYVQPVITLL